MADTVVVHGFSFACGSVLVLLRIDDGHSAGLARTNIDMCGIRILLSGLFAWS